MRRSCFPGPIKRLSGVLLGLFCALIALLGQTKLALGESSPVWDRVEERRGAFFVRSSRVSAEVGSLQRQVQRVEAEGRVVLGCGQKSFSVNCFVVSMRSGVRAEFVSLERLGLRWREEDWMWSGAQAGLDWIPWRRGGYFLGGGASWGHDGTSFVGGGRFSGGWTQGRRFWAAQAKALEKFEGSWGILASVQGRECAHWGADWCLLMEVGREIGSEPWWKGGAGVSVEMGGFVASVLRHTWWGEGAEPERWEVSVGGVF